MSRNEARGMFSGFYLSMLVDAWWDHRLGFACIVLAGWLLCYVSMGGFRRPVTDGAE